MVKFESLKRGRVKRGLSREQLAQVAQVKTERIQELEEGVSGEVLLDELMRLAKGAGLKLVYAFREYARQVG